MILWPQWYWGMQQKIMQPYSTKIYQIGAFFDPSMALKWPVLGHFHENMYNCDENKSECVV